MTHQITRDDSRLAINVFTTSLMAIGLIVFTLWAIYSIVMLWPQDTDGAVQYLLWRIALADETRLLIIVILAGALGSMIHTHRSFYYHIGNRDFGASWIPFYIVRPFVGAILALVFYLVIRGGFFAQGSSVEATSPFGFAALAGLVGLFSEQAILKLKQVAETLFIKPEPAEEKPAEGAAEDESEQSPTQEQKPLPQT